MNKSGLVKIIKHLGSVTIDKFINLCLYHDQFGYYTGEADIGKKDFVTAPHLTSLFGEIIAIYLISELKLNRKVNAVHLVECGAGQGKLMADVLDVLEQLGGGNFIKAVTICERSARLIGVQKERLVGGGHYSFPITWVSDIDEIDYSIAYNVVLGNEFLDSMAIKQYMYKSGNFHEVGVTVDNEDNLNIIYYPQSYNDLIVNYCNGLNSDSVTFKENDIIEIPIEGILFFRDVLRNIKVSQKGGAILMIDYGGEEFFTSSTVQSIYQGEKSSFINNIGYSDITHLVQFSVFKNIMEKYGCFDVSLLSQRDFLLKYNIEERYNQGLANKSTHEDKQSLTLAIDRLINVKGMGTLFKVLSGYL